MSPDSSARGRRFWRARIMENVPSARNHSPSLGMPFTLDIKTSDRVWRATPRQTACSLGAQRRTRIELEFAGNEDAAVGPRRRSRWLQLDDVLEPVLRPTARSPARSAERGSNPALRIE